MPDEKRCREIDEWLENLDKEDMKFLTWLWCKTIKDGYNPYANAPTTKQEYLEWNSDRTIYEGLKELQNVLDYEW